MRCRPILAFVLLVGCGGSSPPPSAPAPTTVDPVDGGAPTPIASASTAPAPNPSDVPYDPPPPADPPPVASAQPDPIPENAQPWKREPTAAEKKACAAKGGKLQPVCMSGAIECVVRYKDAGKRCTDKSDCTGDCLYEGSGAPKTNAVGVCQRTSDPCGCKTPIHHGKADVGICTD